ncbi:hypothetical protein GCM10020255_079770 [Rhodococcus baikonurensis]
MPSASLILDDPNLLFVNAGMVPFVPFFLGQQTPSYSRATSVQKCVRTLDIEEVGITTRHNTFFQMAGNFSFGDYFKKEAISHAWQLLTGSVEDGGYGIDPTRLWATVYLDDDEAFSIWRDEVGVPEERIQRRGMKDNYWSMGIPGPCGPCSEIFYDRGAEYGVEGGPEADEDRYIEIWNLVFMQNERGEGTNKGDYPILGPLPKKNIDTGMGVERVAFLLQGVENVYETDLLRPVIDKAAELTGSVYGTDHTSDVRFRVIADHARTAAMLIADGVNPGNYGRGYVLRRLLRRIVRSAKLLGSEQPTMREFMIVVRDTMAPSYPVLETDFTRIENVAVGEETAFLKTLASGSALFENAAETVKSSGKSVIAGDQAFALHDTYGFPIDLTLEMASEAGLTVDEDGFRTLMAEQRKRAKDDAQARKHAHADLTVYKELLDRGATEFTGFDELVSEAHVLALIVDGVRVPVAKAGQDVEVILDRSPLYAESGGQIADIGSLTAPGLEAKVNDVQKIAKKVWTHKVTVKKGEITEGDVVLAHVDAEWRKGATQGTPVPTWCMRRCVRCSAPTRCRRALSTSRDTSASTSPGRARCPIPRSRTSRHSPTKPWRRTTRSTPLSPISTRPRRWVRWHSSVRTTATRFASSKSAVRSRWSCAAALTSEAPLRSVRSRCSVSSRWAPESDASRRTSVWTLTATSPRSVRCWPDCPPR